MFIEKPGVPFFKKYICKILGVLSIATVIFLLQHNWTFIQKKALYSKDISNNRATNNRNLPMKKLPQALIIGAKKCGTVTLKSYLRDHPSLAVDTFEAHFFDKRYEKGYKYYLEELPTSLEGQITIEGTPAYLPHPEASHRIHEMNSSIKLILIVTDPTRRIVSEYTHLRENGKKPSSDKSFVQVVFDEEDQVQTSYEPVTIGMYSVHLKRYYTLFPKDQFLFIDGDNFRKKPWEELKRVEDFLHIESYFNKSHFIFSEEKGFYCKNESGIPRCMKKNKGREHPDVPDNYLKRIREFYAPYNEEFFKMTGLYLDWNKKSQTRLR